MSELTVRQERPMTDEEVAFCERSIPDAFDEAVKRYNEALAIDGDERATYLELSAATNRIACGLQHRLGEEPAPVGILLGSTRGYVEALLGVLKAGKIAMPLDLTAPRERLESCLADSGAQLVLGDGSFASVGELVDPNALDCAGPGPGAHGANADSPSLLMYTSGSTGEPKGILKRHGTDLHGALMWAHWKKVGPGSRVGQLFSLAFAAAQTEILGTLLSGATLLRYGIDNQSLSGLPGWIAEHEISAMTVLPSLVRPLATAAGPGGLPSLKTLAIGAEPLAASDVELARSMLGPTARLLQGYGATEAGTVCAMDLNRHSMLDRTAVPVGSSWAGKTVRLTDVEDDVGEIVVTSRYLAHGYWRQEEATARAFFVDPVSGQRSFRTGDFGRIDEHGQLVIVGRRDRMVKVAGKRVELDAVEHALRADERVDEAAVVARQRSNGTNALVAFVTPAAVDPRAVKDGLRGTLPPYMVPGRIVKLDALPRLPGGKIDRRALANMRTSTPTPAPGDLEQRLVEIWEELLELPVGMEEDFFELGGDSLLAMELLVEIEERLGHSLTPEALLNAPTIRSLAKRISTTPRLADRSGSSSESPPVFLVHEVGGSGLRYRLLARELGDEYCLCSLEAPWWDGRMHKIRTVEQLAAFHVAKIRRAQPAGPYLLVGYSLGGVLALEIAQQLRADGEEIGLLAVLDTPITFWRKPTVTGDPRTWPMPAPTTTAHRIRRWLWMRWAIARHNARRICSWAIERCKPRRIRRRVTLARLRLVWWLDIHLRGAVPERRRAMYVIERLVVACQAYAPLPYDGRVVLFRCTRRSGPDLGWGDIVRGGLEIHDVDSDHLELLSEQPYVYELASKLGPVIRSAREDVVGRAYGDVPVHG